MKSLANNKKKFLGFLRRDTVFTGDFSKDGKLHTVQNLVRLASLLLLIYSTVTINAWLGSAAIVLVGFTIRPAYMRPEYIVGFW